MRAIATPPNEPTKYVEESPQDIKQRKIDEEKHNNRVNSYSYKRRLEYEKLIDPNIQEATADLLLENDSSKVDDLAAIRADIKLRYPK